jgi:hypothetical protein
MGWSSWCTNDICGIPDLCSEFEVRNKADAMVANGMRDAGYTMMLLDDCWAAHDRDENGELQPMPFAFPTGKNFEKLVFCFYLLFLLYYFLCRIYSQLKGCCHHGCPRCHFCL